MWLFYLNIISTYQAYLCDCNANMAGTTHLWGEDLNS